MFKRWVVGLAVVAALVPAVYFIKPWPWSVGAAELAPMMDRPECAHGTMFVDSAGHKVPRPVTIAISGPISDIPEYHDCQRLLVKENGKLKYGPLIAVYVRLGANLVRNPVGFAAKSAQTSGSTVTHSGITIFVPADSAVPSEDGTQQAVVTILNYGKGSYDQIYIEEGTSCLYVYDGGNKSWAAKIQKVNTDADCKKPLGDWPDAKPLSVKATPETNPVPATRWDWDETSEEHFIGVPCGTNWCEVYRYGLADFGSSPRNANMGKGWYDEQYLAEHTAMAGNPDDLIPGAAVGTAVPLGDLVSHDANDGVVFKGAWIPVAQVALSAESNVYEKKYKYRGGPAPNGQSIVSLCKGSKQDCLGFWPPVLTINRCDNSADPWWARVESPAGTTYRCVVRRKPMDPTAILPPGMVRWRWKLKDEGMWVRCPGGCCEKT